MVSWVFRAALSLLVDDLQQSRPGVFNDHLKDLNRRLHKNQMGASENPENHRKPKVHGFCQGIGELLLVTIMSKSKMSSLLVEDAVPPVVQRFYRLELHIIPVLACEKSISRHTGCNFPPAPAHQVGEESVHPFHIDLVVRPPAAKSGWIINQWVVWQAYGGVPSSAECLSYPSRLATPRSRFSKLQVDCR